MGSTCHHVTCTSDKGCGSLASEASSRHCRASAGLPAMQDWTSSTAVRNKPQLAFFDKRTRAILAHARWLSKRSDTPNPTVQEAPHLPKAGRADSCSCWS